jgi:hypothetical protein
MKKIILISQILFVALFVQFHFTPRAWAAMSPVSITLAPPVQFPPADYNVTGARLGILGHHRNVYGLDVGLVGNITDQDFTGLAVSGLFNYTKGQTTAIIGQFAGLTNINTSKARIYGAQIAALANMNQGEASVAGLQFALANLCEHTKIYGLQGGIYNRAQSVYGLQIGLVNVAEDLHGLQIGLVNFNHKGIFAVSPILNVGW